MAEAVSWLMERNIAVHRPTVYQLKVFEFNFYPDKGTIHIDGRQALPERGLAGLERLLTRKLRAPPARARNNASGELTDVITLDL